MQTITPFLWFESEAEQAAEFYAATIPNSHVDDVQRGPDGSAFIVTLTIEGLRLQLMNGGPHTNFTEAISFMVPVDTQAEIDRLWEALTADGGEPSQCGWLKDRWGLSWQIVPARLGEILGHPDPVVAQRRMAAMLSMGKLDIAALESA